MDTDFERYIKKLYYLSLIPYLGVIFVFFSGAFKIQKIKGRFGSFIFLTESMICLVVFALIGILIIYYFILGRIDIMPIEYALIIILTYISFACTGLVSSIILKKTLN